MSGPIQNVYFSDPMLESQISTINNQIISMSGSISTNNSNISSAQNQIVSMSGSIATLNTQTSVINSNISFIYNKIGPDPGVVFTPTVITSAFGGTIQSIGPPTFTPNTTDSPGIYDLSFTGTNLAGTFQFSVDNSSGGISNGLFDVTFSYPSTPPNVPYIIFSPANENGALLNLALPFYIIPSSTGFSFNVSGTSSGDSTENKFSYHVIF